MSGDSASGASAERDPITDRAASAAQLDAFVDRAHDVAHGIVGDADVAADVVREVFDPLRGERAEEPGAERIAPELTSVLLATRAAALDRRTMDPPPDPPANRASAADDPFATDGRRTPAFPTRVELAQAAAVVLGAEDTSALDLHLRHGIGAGPLAEVLGVSGAEAPERLARLRSRLDDALAAFALWHGGDPACPALAAELDDGTTLERSPFDVVTFGAVDTHRADCAECARIVRTRPNLASLLIAAPVIAAPAALRARMNASPATGSGDLGPVDSAATDAAPPDTVVPAAVAAHRRDSDDTPTALLWAPIDRPARPVPPPVVPRRRDSRRGAIAAALVLVVAGGAIAVRSATGNDRDDTPDPTLAVADSVADGPDGTIEVRSLGPPPPVVDTDTDADTTTATSTTDPTEPDTTASDTTASDTTAPETTAPAAAVPETTALEGAASNEPAPVVATTAGPRPAPRVVTTTTAGPTTTQPDVATGVPPPPQPPTTATTTTTTATTTPVTTTTTTTTVAPPDPTTTIAPPDPTTTVAPPEPTAP